MPLKTDDLKTVEEYKKAIKLDLAKITASGNTKFWVYKDVELPTASGGKQKLPALISLVDDTAAKAVLKGKQPLCRGTCGLKEGKITFEAAQGNIPYDVLIKSVPLLLGKMVHLPNSDDDEAPPATKNIYAELNARWKSLAQQAEARAKNRPDEQTRLAPAMADIPKMLQSGQLVEAEKRIAQFQAALKIPLPPPPPGSIEASARTKYAALNATWMRLSKQAEEKIKANPAEQARLGQPMADIRKMLQDGRLPEAEKRIAQFQSALNDSPPPTAPPGPGRASTPNKTAELNAEWKQLSQQAEARIKAHPGEQARLGQAMTDIPKMLEAGQFVEAEKLIARFQTALKFPPSPPPRPTGAPTRNKAAELNATWKDLLQRAEARIKAHPTEQARLAQAMEDIPKTLQEGQLAEAEKLIARFQTALSFPPPPTAAGR